MPAKISGYVFNDANHNGTFNTGESGISGAYLVLYNGSSCINTTSNSTGYYEFANITTAGTYTVYEVVANPGGTCPPTVFTQPVGFDGSTTRRKTTVTISATDITGNVNKQNNNFGHDYVTTFGCSPFAWQYADGTLYRIDLATGLYSNQGKPTPTSSNLNAIGYNVTDGNNYGFNYSTSRIFRSSKDNILMDLPVVPNLPGVFNCGDIDKNGYLYVFLTQTNVMYVVDVNPNRATYGLLVSPQNGFQEDTTAPFGTTLTSTLTASDMAFNPQDNMIYMVISSGNVVRIDPITGVVTQLTTNPVIAGAYGGQFFDNYNHLYSIDNSTGRVRQYTISGNNVTVTNFSTSVSSTANDGARCNTAPIYFAIFEDPITKTATSRVGVGDEITYTMRLNNIGNVTAQNSVLIDTIPIGTTYVNSSAFLDNVAVSGNPNPPTGISLGNITVGLHTLTFKVLVNTVPNQYIVQNQGTLKYEYVDTIGNVRYYQSNNTTVATTTVVDVILQSVKSVDKVTADIGDILNYSIAVTNTGNNVTNSITLKDTIPLGTTYVNNSLKQDTTALTTQNLNLGVTLPNPIYPGETSIITFSVIIVSIPSGYYINNSGSFNFNFIGNNVLGTIKTGSSNTNTVSTIIYRGDIQINKYESIDYAQIGDPIDYTITLKNIGSTIVNNIYMIDTIPQEITLQNSVSPIVIQIPYLDVGVTYTITFQGVINGLPTTNPIKNMAQSIYSYSISDTRNNRVDKASNIVQTTINQAILSMTKNPNITNGFVNNIITYTLIIKNSGNIVATNILFRDTLPTTVTYINNSFMENSVIKPGNLLTGIQLNNINPNGVSTLQFKVTINTIPIDNHIFNAGIIDYTYIINPITILTNTVKLESNNASTYVNPESNPLKIVDRSYAKIGETIKYTTRWINNLSGQAFNIRFIDTIPEGTTFIPNSININGTTLVGGTITPPLGVYIGTLPVGSVATVTFSVLVASIPPGSMALNTVTTTYDFVVDTIVGTIEHQSSESNMVDTKINNVIIKNINKMVSENIGTIKDILTYTITFSTEGNKDLINFKLIDTIPSEVEYISDSLNFNGTIEYGQLPSNFLVTSIPPNTNNTITYKVIVKSYSGTNPIPNNGTISGEFILDEESNTTVTINAYTNTVYTLINYSDITIAKIVDYQYRDINEDIKYTLIIRNLGNITANNMVLNDTIPGDITFITGSVNINNINYPTISPNNIYLGNLSTGSIFTVDFKVKASTIPIINPIENQGVVTYTYTVDTSRIENSGVISNSVFTQINNVNLQNTGKYVDRYYATCNELLEYTFVVINTGNVAATNIMLYDTISQGLSFVNDSLTINGAEIMGADPRIGVNIGTVNPYSTKTVTFKVRVICN